MSNEKVNSNNQINNNLKRKISHKKTTSCRIEFNLINPITQINNEKILTSSELKPNNKRLKSKSPPKHYTQEHINNLFSHINWKIDKLKNEINSIIIFDWDDTLMCTYSLSKYGYYINVNLIPKNILIQISLLEITVMEILEKSLQKGDTFIITNSDLSWLDYSCKKFFPNIYPLLKKIKIISSRNNYEEIHPNCVSMWKREAFDKVIKNYDFNLPTSILCIGDNFGEIEAGRNLEKNLYYGYIKTIKLKPDPNIDDMLIQLRLIIEKFDYLVSTCKNWTINIEKKIQNNNNENIKRINYKK